MRYGWCRACFVACVTALALAGATTAFAAGTGDDPTRTEDVLTYEEAVAKAEYEAMFDAEEEAAASGDRPARKQRGKTGDVSAELVDGPYEYLWTPSHAQEKSYWCGPATVQIIDDYFGSYASQSRIAGYLGTTTRGTDFSLVDNAIRYFTGLSNYYYYGGLTSSTFGTRVQHALEVHRSPVAADVSIDGSLWPYYVYDHPGHILPIEAYDWRYMSLRVNDPYSEAYWRSGGGNTFGHRQYSRDVIWKGVEDHFRRAVVCPG